MSTELGWLKEQIEGAIGNRRDVSCKRMFGCDAFFRGANIFAMVWKEGRIAVKLPGDAAYAELRAVRGVDPWSPGGKMIMRGWLMLPPAWHEDEDQLGHWLGRAHTDAGSAAPKRAAKSSSSAKTVAPAKTAPKARAARASSKKKAASAKASAATTRAKAAPSAKASASKQGERVRETPEAREPRAQGRRRATSMNACECACTLHAQRRLRIS